MQSAMTTAPTNELIEQVKLKKAKVAEYKIGHAKGLLTYDDLAEAGRELSKAMFDYSRARFPDVKAKRIPYQAIIR